MAITKSWLLYRNQYGRRFKNIAQTTAAALVTAGAALRKFNLYAEKGHIAPVMLVAPVASGTPKVGSTLTTTDGTWGGEPVPTSFSYEWQADAVPIAGATAKTYVPVAGDVGKVITCQVTAINAYGPGEATGNALGPITDAAAQAEDGGDILAKPANVTPPSISGALEIGETLTCDPGTWEGNPAPTFAYQWKADSQPIEGATDAAYTLVAADAGAVISCTVVASNSEGSSQRTASATGAA